MRTDHFSFQIITLREEANGWHISKLQEYQGDIGYNYFYLDITISIKKRQHNSSLLVL